MMFFDRFRHRTELTATLVCETAMRVGAGKGALSVSETDLPILRDRLGRPLLPGASLKGVLRSGIEAVLRGIVADSQHVACDRLGDRPCKGDKALSGNESDERELSAREAMKNRRDAAKELCWVCQTFGSSGLASHVVFRDAVAAEGKRRAEVRDGVAIDRDLGRVAGSLKYDFEVLAAGAEFPLTIVMDSTEPWQEGLVVMGVDLLRDGFLRVGGATSRGLGLVSLQADPTVRRATAASLLGGEAPALTWNGYRDEALAALRARVEARRAEGRP